MCNATRLPSERLAQPEDKEDVVVCRRSGSSSREVAACQETFEHL